MTFENLPKIRNKIAFYCATFMLYFFFGIAWGIDGAVVCFGAVHLCVAVILLATVRREAKYLRTFGIVLLSSALGLLWASASKYIYFYPSQRFIDEYGGSEHELLLRVDKVDSYGDTYINYDCSIIMCDGEETECVFGVYPAIRLSSFGSDFVERGDVVSLKGMISIPEKETASGFEEEMYLRSKHIFMICDYSDGMSLVSTGEKGILERIRSRLSDGITRFVGDGTGDEAAIAKCMLLGDKTVIRKPIKDVFRAAGISHVLSVSGLHLSILFMTVALLFGLSRRTARRRFVFAETVGCVLVLLYMCFASFTPSIMRAGFMLIFMNLFSAIMFYVRRFGGGSGDYDITDESEHKEVRIFIFDSLSALFCSGTLIMIISPYSVFDVGMQLSFMSTLGIIIAASVFGKFENRAMNPLLRIILTSLTATLSAVSFTLPICIYNFGAISAVSFISNILIAPVMTPLLAIGLVLMLVSLLPWTVSVVAVCTFIGRICEMLCGFCIKIAEFMGSFVFSVIPASESMILVIVFVIYVVFTVMCMFLGKKKLCTVGCFTLMCLYSLYFGIGFARFLNEFSDIHVNYCTVKERPYFCVGLRNDRIFFDDCSGLASEHIIREALGEQLYDTDNFYLCVPGKEADFESLYFNIEYFDKNENIQAVLLPSKELCISADVDMEAYAELLVKLSGAGFRVEFYGERFGACGIELIADFDVDARSFVFDDTSLVFAKRYDELYADRVSDGLQACVYFCDKAEATDNYGYTSEAELYVSSPLWKKIKGASGIPTRAPELFE